MTKKDYPNIQSVSIIQPPISEANSSFNIIKPDNFAPEEKRTLIQNLVRFYQPENEHWDDLQFWVLSFDKINIMHARTQKKLLFIQAGHSDSYQLSLSQLRLNAWNGYKMLSGQLHKYLYFRAYVANDCLNISYCEVNNDTTTFFFRTKSVNLRPLDLL